MGAILAADLHGACTEAKLVLAGQCMAAGRGGGTAATGAKDVAWLCPGLFQGGPAAVQQGYYRPCGVAVASLACLFGTPAAAPAATRLSWLEEVARAVHGLCLPVHCQAVFGVSRVWFVALKPGAVQV